MHKNIIRIIRTNIFYKYFDYDYILVYLPCKKRKEEIKLLVVS